MTDIKRIAAGSALLGLILLSASCVIAPRDGGYREGYYDRDHHRWYHEGNWHDCGDHDEHCR
jgi:hypothetical protein